jgi:hypothetical protein
MMGVAGKFRKEKRFPAPGPPGDSVQGTSGLLSCTSR